MFNPFYPFTEQLLQALVQKGKTYFVRQTFQRGKHVFDEGIKGYFIFTHYDNVTTAQDHYGAISYDPNRFLYDWKNTEHQQRLKIAAHGNKEYKVFSSVTKPGWERGINDRIQEKVRKHVYNLGWSPKGGETVDTSFRIKFGELYIVMKWGDRVNEEKFEKIEKLE